MGKPLQLVSMSLTPRQKNTADLPGWFCGNLDRFISHWLRTLDRE